MSQVKNSHFRNRYQHKANISFIFQKNDVRIQTLSSAMYLQLVSVTEIMEKFPILTTRHGANRRK